MSKLLISAVGIIQFIKSIMYLHMVFYSKYTRQASSARRRATRSTSIVLLALPLFGVGTSVPTVGVSDGVEVDED